MKKNGRGGLVFIIAALGCHLLSVLGELLVCNKGYVNHVLNNGTSVCQPCSPGSYTDQPAMTECIKCDAGYVQLMSAQVSSASCQGCMPGTYQTGLGMGRVSDCLRCPAGTHQTGLGMGLHTDCILCRAGTYQSLLGQAFVGSCILCKAGEYQTMLGAQNQTACEKCTAGTYQSVKGGQDPCVPCGRGFYGTAAGMPIESLACIPCPVGTYQSRLGAVNNSSCMFCEEGTYQPQLAAQSDEDCVWCPTGTYQTQPAATTLEACLQCPLGTYQPGLAATTLEDCLACEVGTYQSASGGGPSETCLLCPAGTFQTSHLIGLLETCIKCAAGLYQPETGASTEDACVPCSAGTFQTLEGSITGDGCEMCPAGTYQPVRGANSSSTCIRCSSGSYLTEMGAVSSLACMGCGAGKFSSGLGMAQEQVCALCTSGSYQSEAVLGASTCLKCAPGTYQLLPGQTACTPCRPGTFQPFAGASVDWWCKECVPGTFSNVSGAGSETSCEACSEGLFSSRPGQTACQKCSEGLYSPALKSRLCFSCMSGTYANTTGASVCHGCSVGESVAVSGASACTRCAPGEFQFSNSSSSCLPCPPGQFQSGHGSTTCSSCGEGSFQSDLNSTGCDGCLPGTFAALKAMAQCLPCPQGMFQAEGNSTFCISCSPGTFQDSAAQTTCIPCPAGFFQYAHGASVCMQCPMGEFQLSIGSSSCEQCPVGSYRDGTGGGNIDACRNCTAGTYNQHPGATKCRNCAPGTFSIFNGTTLCTSCGPGGFQASSSTSSCDQCIPGKYSVDIGLTTSDGCLLCPVGSFAAGSGTSQCHACPLGKFSSVLGAHNCSICPPGTYMSEEGWGRDGCVRCRVGTFSPESGATSDAVCELCPDGFFSSSTGQSSSGACIMCKHGTVSVDEKGWCRVCGDGELCPAGYHIPIQCVPGLRCNGTHIQALGGRLLYVRGNCTGAIPCPRGTRCFEETDDNIGYNAQSLLNGDLINQTHFVIYEGSVSELPLSCPGQSVTYGSLRLDWPYQEQFPPLKVLYRLLPAVCPAGTYLLYDTCTSCPAGTFSPTVGALTSNTCILCPTGTFRTSVRGSSCSLCPVGGYSNTEGLKFWFACRPGTYQPSTGATACIPCSAGTFASGSRSVACIPCKAGEFQSRTGGKTCLPCHATQFSSSGDNTCSPCGSNLASLDPGFSCTPPVMPSERGGVTWLTLSGDVNDPDQCLSTGSIPASTLVSPNQLAISYVLMSTRPSSCITTLSVVDRPRLSRQWATQVGHLRRPVSVRVIPFNQTFYHSLCLEQGFSVLFTVADEEGVMTTDLTGLSATMTILDPVGLHVFFSMACERMPDDPNAKVPLGVCITNFCPTVSVIVRVTIQGVGITGQTLMHPGPTLSCTPTALWMAGVDVIRGNVPHFPGSTFDVRVMALNSPAGTRLAVFRFALRILGGASLLSVTSSYSVVTERDGDVIIVVGDASQGGGGLLATLVFRVDASTSGIALLAQVVPQSFQFTLVNAVPYVMSVRTSGFTCRTDGYIDLLLDYPRATALITNMRRPYVINWRRIQPTATDNPTAIHVVAVNNVMNSFGVVRATCTSTDIRNFDIDSCDIIRAGNVGNFNGTVLVNYQQVSSIVPLKSWVPTAATFGVVVTEGGVSGRYRVRATLTAGSRVIHGVDATPFLSESLAFGATILAGGLWKCDQSGGKFTIGAPVMFSGVCGQMSAESTPGLPTQPTGFFLISESVPGVTALGSYTFPPAVISVMMMSGVLLLFPRSGVSLGIANITLGAHAVSRLISVGDTVTLKNTGSSARCVEVVIYPTRRDLWNVFTARLPVFPAAPSSLDITLSTPVILAQDHSEGLDTFIPVTAFVVKAFLVFSDGSRLPVQDDARLKMESLTLIVSGLAASASQLFPGNGTLSFTFQGIPCVSMRLELRVVMSSVQEVSLVCPECPPVLSLQGDPLSQQIPSRFPSAFQASAVMVRRLLVDGRTVYRSEPPTVVSGTSVTLTPEGRLVAAMPGITSISTLFTPGQTISVTVIRRWVSAIDLICNGRMCSQGDGIKLTPRGDGASMPPFGYSTTLMVGLSLTLYNGSIFAPPWLTGLSLLVNGTASNDLVMDDLWYGGLSLGAIVPEAWDLDNTQDLTGGVFLQVERLSRLTVQGPHELRQVHCSGFWEAGHFVVTGELSDGITRGRVQATLNGTGVMVMHDPVGGFHALSPGIGEVHASFGGLITMKTVSALEESIFFTGVSIDTLPSLWTGFRGTVLLLSPVFTPPLMNNSWYPVLQVAAHVLQWSSSDPQVIEVAVDNTRLVLRSDWYRPVTVTAAFRECPLLPIPPQHATKEVTVNIVPSATGDIDIGAADGAPLPMVSIGGTLNIPVFVNILAPGKVQSYLVDVTLDGSGLVPAACSPGSLPNSQCVITKNRVRYVAAFGDSQLSGRILLGTVHATVLLNALAVVYVALDQCVVSETLLPIHAVSYIVRLGSGPLTAGSDGPPLSATRRVLTPGGSDPGARVYGDTDGDGSFTPMDVLFMEKYMALGVLSRPARVCVLQNACQSTTRLSSWQLLQLKPVRNPALPATRPDGSDVLFLLMALVGKTFFLVGLDLQIGRGTIGIRIDLVDYEQTPNPENAVVRVGLVTSHNTAMAFDTPYSFDSETSTITVTCRRAGPDAGFLAASLRTSVLVDEPSVGLRVDLRSLDEWGSQASGSLVDRRFLFGPSGPITVITIMGSQTLLRAPGTVTYIPTLNCEFLCDDSSLFLDGTIGAPVWLFETVVQAPYVPGSMPIAFRGIWGKALAVRQPSETIEPPSTVVILDLDEGSSQLGVVLDTLFNVTLPLPDPAEHPHVKMALYTVDYPLGTVILHRAFGAVLDAPTGNVPKLFVNLHGGPDVVYLGFRMLREGQHTITIAMSDSSSAQGVSAATLPTTVLQFVVSGVPPSISSVRLTPQCTRGVLLWSALVSTAKDERCLVDVVAYEADGTERARMTLQCTQYPCVLQVFGYAVRPQIRTITPTAVRFIVQRPVISVGHRTQWRLVCDTVDQTGVTVSESAVREGLVTSAPPNALAVAYDTIRGNTPGFATVSFASGLVSIGVNVTRALNPPNRLTCIIFTSVDLVLLQTPPTTVAIFNPPSSSAPLLAGSRFFLSIRAVYSGGYSLLLDPTPGVDGITVSSVNPDVIVSHLDGSVFVSATAGGGAALPLIEVVYQGVRRVVSGAITPLTPWKLEVCCDVTLAAPSSNLHGLPGFRDSFIIPPPTVLLAGGRIRVNISRLEDSTMRVEYDQSVLKYDHVSGLWTLTSSAPTTGSSTITLTYTRPKSLDWVSAQLVATMATGVRLDVASPTSLFRIHCSPFAFQAVRVTTSIAIATGPDSSTHSIDVSDEVVLESSDLSVVVATAKGQLTGKSVGTVQITVRARGLTADITVNVLDESVVVTMVSAPGTYDLVGVRDTSIFPFILTGTLGGKSTDITFLGSFAMDHNPYVYIQGTGMVINRTSFNDGWQTLRSSIPPCLPLDPIGFTAVSMVRTRAVAGVGETDLELVMTRESITLALVASTPILSFYVQIRTDAYGFLSCVSLEGMPVFSDCVFDQPFPLSGEVIVAGALATYPPSGPRLELVTLVTQSAVTSLWGFVEVFDGLSVKRFSVQAAALSALVSLPHGHFNESVAVLVPTLPAVDTQVISKSFLSLFNQPKTQTLQEAMFQLALLVKRQRLVDVRVYSNEFELSVMFFVMDRFLQAVPGNDTLIHVLLRSDLLDLPGSTIDPISGARRVDAKHVLNGWYAVELRQKMPLTTLSISFTVVTPTSGDEGLVWHVAAPVEVGHPLPVCPRTATHTATFLVSYDITIPLEYNINASAFLENNMGLIGQLACSVQVAIRRVLLQKGENERTLRLTVALESLTRVHQANLILMGGWLSDELERRLAQFTTRRQSIGNHSLEPMPMITIERGGLSFVNDTGDPPRPCPVGYYFSQNGTYLVLPAHSITGFDCYDMFCLPGFTAKTLPDGTGRAHCIPTPVPTDIIWICVIVILTSVLALAALICCVKFALWTTAKDVTDVLFDPTVPDQFMIPNPSSVVVEPTLMPPTPNESDDPFTDNLPAKHSMETSFHNTVLSSEVDDFSSTLMMDDDEGVQEQNFNGAYHGLLMARPYS